MTDQPAEAMSIAQSGLTFPSVQGTKMFWSPLRTAAFRTGPTFHCVPLWGTRRKRLHRQQPFPEALLLHSQPAARGYPGICCMASHRAQLAKHHSLSLHLQCKSKLCKPQLPAHVSVCPRSHPHLHGCYTATAGRRGQRTHHSAAYRSREAVHSLPLPARALVFTAGDIPD